MSDDVGLDNAIDNGLVAILVGSGLYIIRTVLKALPAKGDNQTLLAKIENRPLFAWHPTGVSLGALILTPVAYTLVRKRSVRLSKNKRSQLALKHAIFTMSATTLGAVGVWAIVTNKNRNKWPHLRSVHSWLGATTATLYLASALSALAVSLGLPNSFKAKLPLPLSWNNKYHRLLGAASVAVSGLAVATGVTSKWGKGKKVFGETGAYALAAVVASSSILLSINLNKYVEKKENQEDGN